VRRSITFRISLDGALVGERTFEEPTIKIGNASTAHIRLEHPSISRVHCVIEVGAELSIMDLGSESGTFVNAAPITRATFASGDQLRIGPFVLDVTVGEATNLLGDPAPTKPPVEAEPVAGPPLRTPSLLDLHAAQPVALPPPPAATVELAPTKRADTVELTDSDLVEVAHEGDAEPRRGG
jgi:pSer/pThr/pTyr-binding forkhead associated (FHA) protein